MKLSHMSKRKMGFLGLAALLVGVLVFALLRSGPMAPTKITVTQVGEGGFEPELFGIGTVEARRGWMIGPTAAARVLSVRVDVGDEVRAGQVLAEMDPVDLDQRLIALDAAVERAKSAEAVAAAQHADALAKRDLAASNLRRNQDLADRSFISSGSLESHIQARASADALLDSARASASAAAQDLLRTRAERAALAQQRANVRLVAPADAVVAAREAEPGSTLVAGQAVLRLVDPASLWVKLRVDQGRSNGLVRGAKAKVVLRSRPQQLFTGVVSRVELLADAVAEERIAALSFDKIPAGLSVGEMAEATIQLPPIARSLLVPAASLQRNRGVTGVWRMASGKPVFAPVQTGATSLDGQVQVLGGLRSGDEVVVYSHRPLAEGARVQVVDAIVKPAASVGAAH